MLKEWGLAMQDDQPVISPQTNTDSFQSPPPAPPTSLNNVQTPRDSYNTTSIVIFVLLLLTFFSPLGSILFLPIVLVGLFYAVTHARKTTNPTYQDSAPPRGIIFTVLKVLMIVGLVIGAGFLLLIGFFFILFSTGGGRMGS